MLSEETHQPLSTTGISCRWLDRDSEPNEPPPAYGWREWRSSRDGFVFHTAYYTRPQIDDQQWETFRRGRMDQVKVCSSGYTVVQRDVRWFRTLSGTACAAVVYTAKCDAPKSGGRDTLAEDRQSLLLKKPDNPLLASCQLVQF